MAVQERLGVDVRPVTPQEEKQLITILALGHGSGNTGSVQVVLR